MEYFGGFEAGVRAELIRGIPEPLFDVAVVSRHGCLSRHG
jgi:hypothetical protein